MNKRRFKKKYLSYMVCYIEKTSEAVKLCQDLDELFDNKKLRNYMTILSGTKKLRHRYIGKTGVWT